MLSLIIYFPLINAIIIGSCGNMLGLLGIRYISALSLFGSQLICFYLITTNLNTYIDYGFWMAFGTITVKWSFLFDNLTLIMFIVVNFVSCLVHLYSFWYMNEDPSLPRFIAYLSLFTFFMNVLVSAGNLIVLFIGWEGVGLCSYLLIGFWYTRFQANKAAMKALVVNRIGDYFFLLACFLILIIFQSTEWSIFLSFFYLTDSFILNNYTITIISLFLFFGAMAKSAQIGLHTWLPDAMEGPTPVSALIHAATMVTAGVFLLLRVSSLLCFTPKCVLLFITIIGALTAFFAATAGLVQNDLKKVIAYSTCSQLGYMIFSCGLLNFSASFFHLFNHAFFKALLFLGAGSVIHSLLGEQDMRRMGGLAKQIPFISCIMLIGSLSLAGFPFLSGFYSKDIILEMAFAQFSSIAAFTYWIGVLVAFLTAFYSFRLLILVFLGHSRSFKNQVSSLHATTTIEIIVLLFLCILSIISGFLGQNFFVSLGSDFLPLYTYDLSVYGISDFEFLPLKIKLLPTFCSLFGVVLSFILHSYINFFSGLRRNYYLFYVFLMTKWGFDFIFNTFISKTLFLISLWVADLLEKQLEYFALSFIKIFTFIIWKTQTKKTGVFSFVQITFLIFFLILFFLL